MAIKRSTRPLLLGSLSAVITVASSLALAPSASCEESKRRPHIDLAFCIDTTGSMQSEIDNVKAKTKEIVAKLAGGKPSPVIRVGVVAYRDRGDAYVTKVFPFTENIDHVVKDVTGLKADGGGDTPESVNEALHVAVHDLKWSDNNKTLKLLFLIGDAGPHFYPKDYDWHNEAKEAVAHGVQINTIGCQGLETSMPASEGVDVFKEIARIADGKYEPLSYRHEVAQADGKKATVISSGGRLYKLDAASAGDWRAGASVLSAARRAAEVDSVSEYAAAAPMAALGAPGAMRGVRAKAALGGGAAGALQSRDENNLTDLVLSATREAAKKKLNVEFKGK